VDEIPLSTFAGYDGRSWCVNRGWAPCRWESHKLEVGDRVTAVLTTPSAGGVFAIFVNDHCTVAVSAGFRDYPVWGVVDLLTSEGVASVRLMTTHYPPRFTFSPKKTGLPLEYSEFELLHCQELQTRELHRRAVSGKNISPIADLITNDILAFKDSDASGVCNFRVLSKVRRSSDRVLRDFYFNSMHPGHPLISSSSVLSDPTGGVLLTPEGNQLFNISLKSPTVFLSLPDQVEVWRLQKGNSILIRTVTRGEADKAIKLHLGLTVTPAGDAECEVFASIQFVEHSSIRKWAQSRGLQSVIESVISYLNR
jgi:hypothetical protein